MLSGETAAGAFPVDAVRVMSKICRESEVSIDHYQLFKSILAQVPIPIAPVGISRFLSRAHRTEGSCRPNRGPDSWRIHRAARGEVQTRSSVLTVFVPTLTTDSLAVALFERGAGKAGKSDQRTDSAAGGGERKGHGHGHDRRDPVRRHRARQDGGILPSGGMHRRVASHRAQPPVIKIVNID